MIPTNYYSEEHKAQIYEIRTLPDIFNLPTADDVRNCLHDISEAMLIARKVNDTVGGLLESRMTYPEVTKWINDGKHDNMPNFIVQVGELPEKKKTTEERLRFIIADWLGLDEAQVTLKSKFIEDLGADSLDIVELLLAVEDEFNIEIPDKDSEGLLTVDDLVTYIEAAIY